VLGTAFAGGDVDGDFDGGLLGGLFVGGLLDLDAGLLAGIGFIF